MCIRIEVSHTLFYVPLLETYTQETEMTMVPRLACL